MHEPDLIFLLLEVRVYNILKTWSEILENKDTLGGNAGGALSRA
jgi:hypothetical protein